MEVENLVMDHLLCMHCTNTQKLLINNFLLDDMLLMVMASNSCYANIISFMVSVIYYRGEQEEANL